MQVSNNIYKSNGIYTIGVSGNGKKLVYFGQKENILCEQSLPPIFRVRFVNEDGSFSLLTAQDAGNVEIFDSGETLELRFGEFAEKLTVVLRVKCPKNDKLSYWSIQISSDKQIEWAEYPCVCVKDSLRGKGNSKILWPYNEGLLTDYIHEGLYLEPEYPSLGAYAMYPGMIFAPFIAYVDELEGLYFGAHDGKATRQVAYYRDGEGVRLQLRVYPSVYGGEYVSGEETVLGAQAGDWYSYAEIYRDYFENNKGKEFVKIEDNPDLPEWYKKSPVVITYPVRGVHDADKMTPNKFFPYVNALPVLDDYAEKLDSSIMAILMHWEGTAPWAPPYVWPPYGGEKALEDFINAMHDRGNLVGVYCSGLGWTQKSNLCEYSRADEFEKEGLARYMNTAPDGSLPLSKICTAQRSGYDLCISQDFTKQTLSNEVDKMAGAGLDYVQLMDQNHGGTPYMCYARNHGHPPVPGKWQSEELNDLLGKIRANHKGLMFGCESAAAEVFIPNLLFSDNRDELCYRYGVAVPLYSYLYHEYINNFQGNNVLGDRIFDCKRDKDCLAYRNAYSFVAGDMLTIIITQDGDMQWAWIQRDFSEEYMPEQEENKKFIRLLNGFRQKYPEFLHSGKMLRRPKSVCAKRNLAIFMGDREEDSVLSACYQSRSGEIATFFANWTREEQKVSADWLQGKIAYCSADTHGEYIKSDTFTVAPRSVVMVKM